MSTTRRGFFGRLCGGFLAALGLGTTARTINPVRFQFGDVATFGQGIHPALDGKTLVLK